MGVFSWIADTWRGWRERRASKKRRDRITEVVAAKAYTAISVSDRFAIQTDVFDDVDHLKTFLVVLSARLKENVRASAYNGLLVVYLDDGSPEGLGITVAGGEDE
jgi:antirestriction protein ArdC